MTDLNINQSQNTARIQEPLTKQEINAESYNQDLHAVCSAVARGVASLASSVWNFASTKVPEMVSVVYTRVASHIKPPELPKSLPVGVANTIMKQGVSEEVKIRGRFDDALAHTKEATDFTAALNSTTVQLDAYKDYVDTHPQAQAGYLGAALRFIEVVDERNPLIANSVRADLTDLAKMDEGFAKLYDEHFVTQQGGQLASLQEAFKTAQTPAEKLKLAEDCLKLINTCKLDKRYLDDKPKLLPIAQKATVLLANIKTDRTQEPKDVGDIRKDLKTRFEAYKTALEENPKALKKVSSETAKQRIALEQQSRAILNEYQGLQLREEQDKRSDLAKAAQDVLTFLGTDSAPVKEHASIELANMQVLTGPRFDSKLSLDEALAPLDLPVPTEPSNNLEGRVSIL